MLLHKKNIVISVYYLNLHGIDPRGLHLGGHRELLGGLPELPPGGVLLHDLGGNLHRELPVHPPEPAAAPLRGQLLSAASKSPALRYQHTVRHRWLPFTLLTHWNMKSGISVPCVHRINQIKVYLSRAPNTTGEMLTYRL